MFLDRIIASKQKELEELRSSFSYAEAERQIAAMPPCRGFARRLTTGRHRSVGLIAEVKKASPSKGLIRPDFHPVAIAEAYVRAGADCLSVLTDGPFFQGANAYLQQVREAVEAPLLRKDFTIDRMQVYEARMIGADAVLLIAAVLDDERLRDCLRAARELGLDALVEVHDEAEMERALRRDAALIGINNRNLKTFATDLRVTEQLARMVPADTALVSESGISSREDVAFVAKAGAGALLIGEHFMRQEDIGRAVVELLGEADANAGEVRAP